MTFFSIVESFFFLSLGMSFFLILLMVYHFKKRVDSLESKYETLADISKTLYQEIELIRNPNINLSKFVSQPPTYSQLNYPKMSHNNEKYTPSNYMCLPTDATFISSSSSNPFKELYKKIIISNEVLDAEPPFHDDELVEDDVDDGDIEDNDDLDDDTDEDSADDSDDDEDSEESEDTEYESKYDEDIIDNDVHDNSEQIKNEDVEVDLDVDLVLDDIMFKQEPSEIFTENVLQVMKMEETDVPTEGSILTVEPDTIENDTKLTKSALQKMNVQMLRTIAIRDGICDDPSKYKKLDLINMIIEAPNKEMT